MPFVSFISYGWVWWSQDGTKVHWLTNDRGDHNVGLYELDAGSGDVRVLVEESSTSQILYGPQQNDRNIRTLSTGEVLWWSQRTDWGHLYLYGTDGSVTTLTSGDWGVRHVVTVDEHARRVVFTAGGHDRDADLYLQQLCSVSLDGGPVTAITSDGLDHHGYPSPSGRYFIDSTSRWDTPTFSVLRDSAGAVVLDLEQSDASALDATGWTAPERAVVKAADGVTDVYCSIYRPHDFDPAKSYPVLDCIYPGPQMSCSPQRFPLSGGPLVTAYMAFNFPDAAAALGFVVVTVDGRGSAMRERSFQDHSRNPACVFVDDHVSGITQLAETRPWMDLEKVGIYGYSAGGFGSARAFLQAPDFYKLCISSSGNHDNRINHSWWGEKYFGLADDYDFAAQANASLAENLTGKLLLVHGEMDDNATPHGTMRLADALMKANKDFDLLIIPNADHFMMVHREYFIRRRWDYLVQHLLGETPPPYRLADIPIEPVA
jgi:dipeptidyl aminopeptidase/acylaminoacyl peptidase